MPMLMERTHVQEEWGDDVDRPGSRGVAQTSTILTDKEPDCATHAPHLNSPPRALMFRGHHPTIFGVIYIGRGARVVTGNGPGNENY